ncbi:MAG TPA: SDR family oxidoreductase, partial [Gaiellales bacterium]|nr:SDR family oxidoreductase [Gaiellales bacterium]
MRLEGARVLVAGGAHRVGRAIALDLAEGGADVAISYHSSAGSAEETRAAIEGLGRRTAAFRADAAVPGQMAQLVEQTVEALGGIDCYIHCPSGGFEPRSPEQIDEALWDTAVDSTAKGFMFGAQAAHRHMQAGSVIVAVTDVAAMQPWRAFAAHCAAKAAQVQLMKCLALAWGKDGVRVCGVAPGPVLLPDEQRGATEETALGVIGSPQDVCQAIRYLLAAEFVTGQN